MKKLRIITICAIIYIGLISANTQVFAVSKGKTINETTRMREKSSTSSGTVTLISINQEVEILSEDGDWYKVKYTSNGKTYTGYIRNDLLKTDSKKTNKEEEKKQDKVKEEPKETENEQTVENVQEIEIKEGNKGILKSKTEIRILPLISSNITEKIEKNSEVTISEVLGNWIYVETEKQAGWIIDSELQKNLTSKAKKSKTEPKKETEKKEENKTAETKNKEEQTMYVSSQTVNLRKEANSNSNVLKQLSRNTQVTVIEEVNNTWSKVKVDGLTGYISKTYLSSKKIEITSRGTEKSREEKEIKTQENEKKENSETSNTTKKEESKAKKETTQKTSSKVTGNDIVKSAKEYLGYKYVLGAASPKAGFDCSGLTSYVYKKNGYTLNRTSGAQASNGKKVKKSELKQGDLVFFNNDANTKIGHVGIYIGGGNFIHAANPRKGVIITPLSNSYYAKRYVTARRIIY